MKKLIAFTILLALLITPLPVAFALDYSGADILQELENVDLTGYGKETTVITAAETSDQNVLLYVWNASGCSVDVGGDNNVSMAAEVGEKGNVTNWEKFRLQFISRTEDSKIYKFKVLDPDGLLPLVKTESDKTWRVYDVAELTLHYVRPASEAGNKDWKASDAFYVGKRFSFSGEDAAVELKKDTVVRLEVHPLWYRLDSSPLTKEYDKHQTQLNSVYFSVPEEFFADGYTLSGIKAEWFEYKTKPIVVLENEIVYNRLKKYIGKDIGTGRNTDVYYELYYGTRLDSKNAERSLWGYNVDSSYEIIGHRFDNVSTRLDWLFYAEGKTATSSDYAVSTERLLEYIQEYSANGSYNHSGFVDSANGKVSKDLFEDYVDEGRTMGRNTVNVKATDSFDLLSYAGTHDAWNTITDFGLWNWLVGNVPSGGNIEDVKPIVELTQDMLNSSADVSEEYYIDESQVASFSTFVGREAEKGNRTILFRYAATDYSANDLDHELGEGDVHPNGFVASETVFLNFDVIELEYSNGSQTVVYPVVSDPIDVVPPVTFPVEWLTNIPWWIYAILGVCAVGLLLMIFKVVKE